MKLDTNIIYLFLLITSSLAARVTNPNKVPRNAVLLSKVSSLTLHAGKNTAARRSSAVPQLKCVGPKEICKLYTVDTLRCQNEGSDYDTENVQWTCRAQLPEEFKLGSTEVSCEGYESSDDPYVLKGSCGVEYRLLLTEKGEQRYRPKAQPIWSDEGWGERENNLPGTIFALLFLLILIAILYGLVKACLDEGRRPGGRDGRRPRTSAGGGGGSGGDDDPPPPYDYHPPPPRKKNTYTPQSSTGTWTQTGNRDQTQDGWRPGFWTGAAAGMAGGYLAGRRAQGWQTRTQPQPETQQRRNGSWLFGGGGGTGGGLDGGPPSPRNPSPSYSTSRYESTGFGGTTRR